MNLTESKEYARYLLHHPSEMDWRYLLKQYIKHIGEQEGIDYLRNGDKPEWMFDLEWDILKALSEEVLNDD